MNGAVLAAAQELELKPGDGLIMTAPCMRAQAPCRLPAAAYQVPYPQIFVKRFQVCWCGVNGGSCAVYGT